MKNITNKFHLQNFFLDLKIRGFKKKGHIKYSDIMNITDAVQSIFDY